MGMPKRISYIWFGSKISGKDWSNILTTQTNNPEYELFFYIDSSVVDESAYHTMLQTCKQSNINLVDIATDPEVQKWFGYELLRRIIKFSSENGIKHSFANASDLLRFLIMIYKAGAYADVDTTLNSLLEISNVEGGLKFWQQPRSKEEMLYSFQAVNEPYHPLYILAAALIIFSFQENQEKLFSDNLLSSNKILFELSGKALPHAFGILNKIFSHREHFGFSLPPNHKKLALSVIPMSTFSLVESKIISEEISSMRSANESFIKNASAAYEQLINLLPQDLKLEMLKKVELFDKKALQPTSKLSF